MYAPSNVRYKLPLLAYKVVDLDFFKSFIDPFNSGLTRVKCTDAFEILYGTASLNREIDRY